MIFRSVKKVYDCIPVNPLFNQGVLAFKITKYLQIASFSVHASMPLYTLRFLYGLRACSPQENLKSFELLAIYCDYAWFFL